MTKEPLAVVLMSCYNHKQFVGEAVKSVINQTYENWRLYIVDDGSVDGSGEMLDSFEDGRITVVHLKKNTAGAGAKRLLFNMALSSKADYVCYLDADNVIFQDKIEKQVKFLEEHSQYGAVFSGNNCQSHYMWLEELIFNENNIDSNSVLLRMEAFKENKGMNSSFYRLGGYKLWLDIVLKYPTYSFKEILAQDRRQKVSAGRTKEKTSILNYQESVRIISECLKRIDKSEFYRCFYGHIPYRRVETEEEILAAEFIMLLNSGSRKMEQAALEIYYDNSYNDGFIECLDRRYGFDRRDFLDFAGKSGLIYFVNDIKGEAVLEGGYSKQILPFKVFLDIYTNETFSAKSLHELTATSLLQLYNFEREKKGGVERFSELKDVLLGMRMRELSKKDGVKILFILAENTGLDSISGNNPFEKLYPDAKYYAAYIPDLEHICDFDPKVKAHDFRDDSIEIINIVNLTEQALDFADDIIEELDIICYVDCMRPEYEVYCMSCGYPISCLQYIMCNEEELSGQMKQAEALLPVFSGIYSYM